ncbi:unnamed protein product [Rhodiola kirilowii]
MALAGIEKLHVLAVDDSLIDRTVIERLLKISCCKVTAVESGTRALEFLGLAGEKRALDFEELKVNLIMTDYSMPGMTGYELLKKIKGSSAYKGIPVVLMSSENIITRINSCLEEGAEDFLMKPVKLSDVERLRDCIMKGDDKGIDIMKRDDKGIENQPKASSQQQPSESTTPSSLLTSSQSSTLPSTTLKPSPVPLFASSDLSCSLQHLSSPPSSPHWPSKRPRLLNRDK